VTETGDWTRTFFDAVANDLWAGALEPEHTDLEVEFLLRHLEAQGCSALLDVPSGRGRLTLPLARKGHEVTAADISEDGTRRLRAAARTVPGVRVVQADMRALPLTGPFDGAYCMGNSFGYFPVPEVARWLGEVARVLRPGGKLVFESASAAESLLADFAAETDHTVGGVRMRGRHTLDLAHDRMVSELTFDAEGHHSVRVIDQLVLPSVRIAELVEAAGFAVEHLLGDLEGAPYGEGSRSLLVVARMGG
jgi:SAM-dependent methyltransferase